MRRVSYKSFVGLFFLIFFTLSLQPQTANKLRSTTASIIAPSWKAVGAVKSTTLKVLRWPSAAASSSPERLRELAVMKRENHVLQQQVELLKKHLDVDISLLKQIETLKTIPVEQEFFLRRKEELLHLVDKESQFVSAKVIFREPSIWGSSLWVNVGERTNRNLGKQIISKNSPVVIGTTIVGVVEYVGEKRSRVRLITDASLIPSVRAVRGKEENRIILEKIEALHSLLNARDDLNFQGLQEKLLVLKEQLSLEQSNLYLAKGELRGTSQPLWRSRGVFLRGVGFNYDFSDEEGPARDIRTGEPLDNWSSKTSLSLIKKGDLLVTTGMDGIFPKGLQVAYVTSIDPLVEGACSYNITAKSLVENLDNLASVTILPPYEEPYFLTGP